jgi:hypothetical protein
MMNRSRTDVSTELGLGLVSPEQTIVPLRARLSYGSADPYAVRMAFFVGTDEPVEWILSRDLLAAALHASEGIGDVRAWPAAASCDPPAGGIPGGAAAGNGILNIELSSPFGQAQFEVSARAIEAFLERTYQLVPAGQESGYMDFDTELTELLSQA